MVNRYSGEIHLNPVPRLRNNDFNNEGNIPDINATLTDAIRLLDEIRERLQEVRRATSTLSFMGEARFHFAPGGYISITGITDDQLKELHRKGLIELFDFATDRNWVKRYGHLFGLSWENGQAVEL
ncbi:MAG: hypothetical protein ACK4RF_05940 [Cyclobacteriaceae bacterium]